MQIEEKIEEKNKETKRLKQKKKLSTKVFPFN